MAERTLQQILSQLKSRPNAPYTEASKLLSKAKIALLQLKAVTPSPLTPPSHLALAREVYEAGALFSIRAKNAEAFTRYVSQLQPFYELADNTEAASSENRNKVTSLYLLLLLTQGRYAEFHSELEVLSTRARGSEEIEQDRYLGYPIKLERWLMEGSYDRVWKAMKSREVPSEEYGVFSEVSCASYVNKHLCLTLSCWQCKYTHCNARSRAMTKPTNVMLFRYTDSYFPNPFRDRIQQRTRLSFVAVE
jgi:26S proteasome regulatory subunit N12